MSAKPIPTTAPKIMPCVTTPKAHSTADAIPDTLEMDITAQVNVH